MSHCIDNLARVGDAVHPQRREALRRLFARVGEVTALPESAMNVVRLASRPDADAQEVCEAIKLDPALTTRVLRTVNSSQYGLRNRVGNLQTAVSLLGLREIKALAQSIYLSKMFAPAGVYRSYSRQGLWKHCIAVARLSERIAESVGDVDVEAAYFAGLLHDIGLIVLDQSMRRVFCKVVDELTPGCDLRQIERDLMTFDHTHLGAFLTESWKMPPSVVAAAEHHHEPQVCLDEHRRLVCVVAVANFFVSRHGVPALGVDAVRYPGDAILEELGLDEGTSLELIQSLPEVLKHAETQVGS